MQLTLSDQDARMLAEVLRMSLPELRREEIRTDLPARELRHQLAEQVRLCERLITELEPLGSPPPAPAR